MHSGVSVLEFIAGILLGGVVGVVATVTIQDAVDRAWRRTLSGISRRRGPRGLEVDDLRSIGLITLTRWSTRRPLDPSRHLAEVDDDPDRAQTWFDDGYLEAEVAAEELFLSGIAAQVTRFSTDHGEGGADSLAFRLWVRPAPYAAGVTVQRLCSQQEHWNRVADLFERDGVGALATAPPQHFFVALTVTTRHGRTLAVRRSAATVATARGLWSLAGCETMQAPVLVPGETPEDLFQLAERAAREEFGLQRTELGPVWFSWFGFSRTDGLMAVAHVRVDLDEDELVRRVVDAEGGYEFDALRWVRVGTPEMRQLATGAAGPDWVSFNPVVAAGIEQMWPALTRLPRRR